MRHASSPKRLMVKACLSGVAITLEGLVSFDIEAQGVQKCFGSGLKLFANRVL